MTSEARAIADAVKAQVDLLVAEKESGVGQVTVRYPPYGKVRIVTDSNLILAHKIARKFYYCGRMQVFRVILPAGNNTVQFIKQDLHLRYQLPDDPSLQLQRASTEVNGEPLDGDTAVHDKEVLQLSMPSVLSEMHHSTVAPLSRAKGIAMKATQMLGTNPPAESRALRVSRVHLELAGRRNANRNAPNRQGRQRKSSMFKCCANPDAGRRRPQPAVASTRNF